MQQQQQQAPAAKPPAEDKLARFVSTVLADTEDVWREQFARGGGTYRDPKLVLFRGAVPTACGQGASVVAALPAVRAALLQAMAQVVGTMVVIISDRERGRDT